MIVFDSEYLLTVSVISTHYDLKMFCGMHFFANLFKGSIYFTTIWK